MTIFDQLLADTSYQSSFAAYGIGAVVLVSLVMYIVFSKESSAAGALGDTFFRSKGFAFLISGLLGFAFYYFMQPYFVNRDYHLLSYSPSDTCIGAAVVLWLLLFLLWRARIARSKRKRRRVKPGI